jgi:hypothetical protein
MQTIMSVKLMSIEESLSSDGELICKGRLQFSHIKRELGEAKEIKDELPFRCKGEPAMGIKGSGIGGSGVAQGFIDSKIVQKEGFKDKEVCFVIRNWMPIGIIEPNPFDVADAELAARDETETTAAVTVASPEDAPRPAAVNKFAF